MARSASTIVAKLAWLVPVLLLLLTVHQSKVVLDLGRTVRDGTRTVAEVTRYVRIDRKDVTQAELDLRVLLPDGGVLVRERLSLPYSISHRVEQDTLTVIVLPGSAQEVVIASIVGTQTRIALSNAVMSFIMMLITGALVFAWNRFEKRGSHA